MFWLARDFKMLKKYENAKLIPFFRRGVAILSERREQFPQNDGEYFDETNSSPTMILSIDKIMKIDASTYNNVFHCFNIF